MLKEIISIYPAIFLGLSTKLKENKELKSLYEEKKIEEEEKRNKFYKIFTDERKKN